MFHKLELYYNVNYTVISLVFLAPWVGYSAAAFLNNKIHMNFGQLGVAVIGPSCKIIAYVVTSVHPPYPVLPIILMLAGFGNGLEDGGWNAWIGAMQNANELLGFLHGCYGLGATISPLVATAMVTKGNLPWYDFYYLMVRAILPCQALALNIMIGWPCSSRACSLCIRLSHRDRSGSSR
jgi:fucose permease